MSFNFQNSTFADVNECDDSTLNDCCANANCTDTIGHYYCMCVEGYTGDGSSCNGEQFKHFNRLYMHLCYYNPDIDECSSEERFPCHFNANCNNTVGSFLCSCVTGYTGDGMYCEGNA